MSDSDSEFYGPPLPSSGGSKSDSKQHASSQLHKPSKHNDTTKKSSHHKHKRERKASSSSSSSDDSRDKRNHKRHRNSDEPEKTNRPFTFTKSETVEPGPMSKLPPNLEDIRELPNDFEVLLETRLAQKSLLDMHRDDQRKKFVSAVSASSQQAPGSSQGGQQEASATGRVPFDHERDMANKGGKKMDASSRRAFIAQNQGTLYSSFSHGKRKFL